MVEKRQRLTHLTDFQNVKQHGQSFSNMFMVLLAANNNLGYSRFAVAAGRAVGNAVNRNRVKRRLRSCIDEFSDFIEPGWDLIFYARKPLLTSKFNEINLAMKEILEDAQLMAPIGYGHDA